MTYCRLLLSLAWAGVLFSFTLPGCSCRSESEEEADPDAPWSEENLPALVDAAELKETDVLPHTKGPITPGRNYLYCATFQLAWNEFCDEFTQGPILLEGSPEMAEFLNQREVEKGILSEDSYLAMAGKFSEGIVDEIRAEMKTKFPDAAPVMLEDLNASGESALVAYSYLHKSLPFREEFDDLKARVFHSQDGDVRVTTFGVEDFKWKSPRYAALNKQVTILDYVSDDDFVLRLNTTLRDEELVLAKIMPAESLDATITAVTRRIENPLGASFSSDLKPKETLAVPVVKVGVRRDYSELLGRHSQNPGFEAYFVSYAQQATRFRLDATGARVESEAAYAEKTPEIPHLRPQPKPRQFIFDKPFLIYLRQLDAEVPYFALWVETAEVMEAIRSEE